MKSLSEMALSYLPEADEPMLIHAIQDAYALKYLDTPIMSTEAVCPMCGGNYGYAVYIDPTISTQRMWFCENTVCLALVTRSMPKTTQTMPKQKRALEWALFCELNDIGDIHHNVKFENIHQSSIKIDYLLKFGDKPNGVILMQGEPGAGKTYASMGVCELFTRKSSNAIFCTQAKMQSKWLDTEKFKYTQQLERCNLLVVDDFGTGDVPPGFMRFFLDLINTRTQWTDRGTILTTNLSDADFSIYCGKALNDRIKTGQKFEFKDKSRRKPTVL